MAEDDVTTGELARLIRGIREDIRDMHKSFLAVQVWEVEKRAIEEARASMGREIGTLRNTLATMEAEKEAEHKAIELELKKVRSDAYARDETARRERARNWFAMGLAAFGVVLGIIGNVVVSTLNASIQGG
jgi:hypothetical protein